MDYRQKLIKMIDTFNVKAVEEFKEIELKIIADSRSVFKKNKDYAGHIEKLRQCKSTAQKLNPRSIKVPEDDLQCNELKDHFQRCIVIFNALCDAYIQYQTALMNKANGEEKVKFSEIKNFSDKARTAKTTLNQQLNEVNIRYTEFNEMDRAEEEDDEIDGIKYMTYEAIKGSEEDDR